jgi:hypothetical protein
VHYWQPYDLFPYLPADFAEDSVKHLVLYLDEASELQARCERESNDLFRTLKTVTIILGDHKQQYPFSPPELPVGPDILAARSQQLIGSVLDDLDPVSIGNFEIIFSPYIEAGYHEYCLPKKKPQGLKRGESVFASVTSIEFRSECNCGQGDKNNCESDSSMHASHHCDDDHIFSCIELPVWKAVETTAKKWMKGRYLQDAAGME